MTTATEPRCLTDGIPNLDPRATLNRPTAETLVVARAALDSTWAEKHARMLPMLVEDSSRRALLYEVTGRRDEYWRAVYSLPCHELAHERRELTAMIETGTPTAMEWAFTLLRRRFVAECCRDDLRRAAELDDGGDMLDSVDVIAMSYRGMLA